MHRLPRSHLVSGTVLSLWHSSRSRDFKAHVNDQPPLPSISGEEALKFVALRLLLTRSPRELSTPVG